MLLLSGAMAIRTMGAGGLKPPLTSKAGAEPPKNDL